ncbi:Cyclin-dependent kinase 4 inhibitor D [Exaiptasia diaphana]|nr:Cyclin-dependent kinase 4 inhibitor D [Exaiptasia diaphana]
MMWNKELPGEELSSTRNTCYKGMDSDPSVSEGLYTIRKITSFDDLQSGCFALYSEVDVVGCVVHVVSHNNMLYMALHLALIFSKSPQDLDESGTTALHKAAANGHLEVLKLLVEQGSDVNKTDITGCSPLHAASRNGHMSCVKFLVEHGADFKLKSIKGNTPMVVAKANSQQKVAEYLSTCDREKYAWEVQ